MKVGTAGETCCTQLVGIHHKLRSTAIRKLGQKSCCQYGCLDIPLLKTNPIWSQQCSFQEG